MVEGWAEATPEEKSKSEGPETKIFRESTKTSPIVAEARENFWLRDNRLGNKCTSTEQTEMANTGLVAQLLVSRFPNPDVDVTKDSKSKTGPPEYSKHPEAIANLATSLRGI